MAGRFIRLLGLRAIGEVRFDDRIVSSSSVSGASSRHYMQPFPRTIPTLPLQTELIDKAAGEAWSP